jgi:formate dehydrogenase iron-sulfur subunit
MEGDPFMLIEGMTIAGLAVGANKGYIYVRSEYPHAIANLNEAIASAARPATSAEHSGLRPRLRPGSAQGRRRLHLRRGNALLESIEGKRGMVRAKPPLPALPACSASRP